MAKKPGERNQKLASLIYALTKILPKFHWAIIQTFPIWEENGVVLYRKLIDTNIKKIIWLVPEMPDFVPFQIDEIKTIFIKRKSVKGIFYYMFSKYVFITHGLYGRKFPSNQISVNLWHGMPLKKVGLENGGQGLYTTYTLSTGDYFNEILSKSMGVCTSSILNIGLPRNENLLKSNDDIRKILGISEEMNILFWLPTYRKSLFGEIRSDGVDYGNPFNLSVFDQELFETQLQKNNIICFFKPHPMADLTEAKSSPNFQIISDDFLYRNNLNLYRALSQSDFLISDMSSIVVDYLLLEKPIIFSFADKTEYLKNRGLNLYEILDNPPGRICSNQTEIMDEIISISIGEDKYKEERKRWKEKLHTNFDLVSNCSSILLDKLGLKH